MDFLGQQNIMLDLENKALKQLLESLSHEYFIKHCRYSSFFPGVSLVTCLVYLGIMITVRFLISEFGEWMLYVKILF